MRETLFTAFEQLASLGIGLIQATVVFFIAGITGRAMRHLVRRQLKPTMAPGNVEHIVENAVTFVMLGFGATILLTLWGVTWTTLLTAVGLSTLVVALGLQSVLQGLIAGLFILFERPYSVGDRISFSNRGVSGTVEEIAWRTTVILDDEGPRIIVPNAFALTEAVVNHSPERAVLTIVTVHGAGDASRSLPQTRALAAAALADMPWQESSPDIAVHSKLARLRLPRLVARIPRLGPRLDRLIRNQIDETTDVRVAWTGINDPAMRENVKLRLGADFATSRITVRRW